MRFGGFERELELACNLARVQALAAKAKDLVFAGRKFKDSFEPGLVEPGAAGLDGDRKRRRRRGSLSRRSALLRCRLRCRFRYHACI